MGGDMGTKAVSKSQRRLFALALLYKTGRLDDGLISGGEYLDKIKKLSELPEDSLRSRAQTKQKKRKKDGTISKRNAIPQKVKS